jgi:hypothetical protein
MRASRFVPALALLASACGGKTLVVESDTSWAGAIGAVGDVEGRGNATYELSGTADETCWSIVKLTAAGTLRAYAETSTFFGLGSDVDAESKTIAPQGSVSGCVR